MPGPKRNATLICLAIVLLSSTVMRAQTTPPVTASAGDKKFVVNGMATNLAEIQFGQLALQKTSNSDVKEFAQQLIDDHTKLDFQLKPLAPELGLTPPTQLAPKDQILLTKLQGLSGQAFDKAYISAMITEHKDADKAFKSEEIGGKNLAVKDAATQGESVVAQHLQMAQQLQKKL